MNKLLGLKLLGPSNCQIDRIGNDASDRIFRAALLPGILFVYERCCARREKLSSAVADENRRCRLKPQFALRVCSQTGQRISTGAAALARLYANGILARGF
jgi:hypothetical protein